MMLTAKRRTTLTLPASILQQVEKLARERHVTLSTAVAELLEDGLAMPGPARRLDEVLVSYRTAFAGFTEEERHLLDGVELED